MSEVKANTVKIKALRPIVYKTDFSLKAGETAEVDEVAAERLIAAGSADKVAEKASKSEK